MKDISGTIKRVRYGTFDAFISVNCTHVTKTATHVRCVHITNYPPHRMYFIPNSAIVTNNMTTEKKLYL